MTVVPRRHAWLLLATLIVHGWLVWSIVAQPFDGTAPPTSPRFATAGLHFDALAWPGPGADFFALYHAGIQARRGESPYDQQEEPRVTPYFFRYIYSPLLAETLGRVVTLVPPVTAFRAWLVLMEACLLACLVALWRGSIDRECTWKTTASALLLLSQPYFLELHMGQFTFAAAALTLLAASLVERVDARHMPQIVAGPLLMAAGMLKTFPFVTLPAFLRQQRGRPVAIAAIGAAAAVTMWSVFAPGGSRFVHGFALADEFDGPHPGTFSLLQMVCVAVAAATGVWLPRSFGPLPLIVMIVLLGCTALRVLYARRHDVVLESAVLLVAFFLGFLHVWEHHYSAVLLAGVFLLDRMGSARPPLRGALPLLGVALVVIAAPSPFALVGRDPRTWTAGTWLVMSMSKALPALVVFVVGLRALNVTSGVEPQH